jgi:hypothetical protein
VRDLGGGRDGPGVGDVDFDHLGARQVDGVGMTGTGVDGRTASH